MPSCGNLLYLDLDNGGAIERKCAGGREGNLPIASAQWSNESLQCDSWMLLIAFYYVVQISLLWGEACMRCPAGGREGILPIAGTSGGEPFDGTVRAGYAKLDDDAQDFFCRQFFLLRFLLRIKKNP